MGEKYQFIKRNWAQTNKIWSALFAHCDIDVREAGGDATRDRVAPFMFRYYVYIYYEWYKCKHAARRRLVWSIILAGAAGRSAGAAEIRRKGCVPRAQRPRPSTNYIISVYARLLSPGLAPLANDSFDTPPMHCTFSFRSGRAYFARLPFLWQTYSKCLFLLLAHTLVIAVGKLRTARGTCRTLITMHTY